MRHRLNIGFLLVGVALAFVVLMRAPVISAETIECADHSVIDVSDADSGNLEKLCESNGGVKAGATIKASPVAGGCAKSRFLGMPPWYEYLKYERSNITGRCEVVLDSSNFLDNIWPIGLAILDMILVVAGVAAVGFVMYGGIRYVLSQGQPESTKAARETIINALIGAVVAILAASIVAFVGNRLGG